VLPAKSTRVGALDSIIMIVLKMRPLVETFR
jgi:hypothetical protein